MSRSKPGKLVIVGGHEDRTGDKTILHYIADQAKGGKLVLVTVASAEPEALVTTYRSAFRPLGIDTLEVLDIRTRDDAYDEAHIQVLDDAAAVFFTGGDQLRITSQIGDSLVFRRMHELHDQGVTIAGTSAGAAAMPATMLISGAGDESGRVSALGMAPGLGFIDQVIIDSHFAERGRMGRLLGAVAQNPANLGIGIDEDTAIVVTNGGFEVIGSGAVYVVDGTDIQYSSLSQDLPEGVVSIFNVRLHVLGTGDAFNLAERAPQAQTSDTRQA